MYSNFSNSLPCDVIAEMPWMSEAERSNYAHLLTSMHLSVKKELSARASTLVLEAVAGSSRESPAVDDDDEQRPAQRSPVPSASDLVDQLVQAVLRARHGGARFCAFADADPRDLLRLPDKFDPLFLFSNERYHQLLRRWTATTPHLNNLLITQC